MDSIIVFGAGRSSLYLIEYLGKYCDQHQMGLTVVDRDISYAQTNATILNSVVFVEMDIADETQLRTLIREVKLVVSLLPAVLHIHIAKICLEYGIHLATASYISEEMKALDEDVRKKDLIFLNEAGLDPGIDHMSAMQMMDSIREEGGKIQSFKSYCGGLVADEDDGDNPWKYKFSWNPRNVVLAAQGGPATYLENGSLKLRPYHQIFEHPSSHQIPGYGILEAYPNRDSLKYLDLYRLNGVSDMLRGTFRKPGYSKAWQVFVKLGMTDDTQILNLPETTTCKQWLLSYLPTESTDIRSMVKKYTQSTEEEIDKLDWLGLFSDSVLPVSKGSSAMILEEILKSKWKLGTGDKDLVVMLHEIEYSMDAKIYKAQASMVLKGESNTHTAMAKTVGLPLAIVSRLILEKKISGRGVLAPVSKEIYEPVLSELETYGISFTEEIR